MSFYSLAVLFKALFLAHFGACQLIVNTSNGPIEGHVASRGSSVTEFLGIPFAQPPLGNLRFAPPETYWGNGTYVASQWTTSPPSNYPNLTAQAQRIIDDFAGSDSIPQDENCLTLNVWSSAVGNKTLLPVLIFFYGGRKNDGIQEIATRILTETGFAIGNTHTPFYVGQSLSQHGDVVVVTVNYRLNIFGFPGGPYTAQNLGLQDQRFAVEWLQENIAGFGGDPTKLTIFGQSSGGVAVDYWSYAYANDPIVHGFISESGNAFSFPIPNSSLQESNWYNVSATVGCGNSGNTVACMRNVTWQQLEKAAGSIPSSSGGSPVRSVPPFYPKVDNVLVFSNYTSLAKAGKFAKLPYLLGNNNHEQGYYILAAYAHGINVTKQEGDQFLLSSFTCPNAFEAEQRTKYNVPVYLYRYFGTWKNLELYPGSGAYHGTDLEMVFGNSGKVSGIPPSKAEVQTSRLMQRAWVAFANDPADGLTNIGWPRFDAANATLAELAYNNKPTIRLVKPSVYDGHCSSVTLGSNT